MIRRCRGRSSVRDEAAADSRTGASRRTSSLIIISASMSSCEAHRRGTTSAEFTGVCDFILLRRRGESESESGAPGPQGRALSVSSGRHPAPSTARRTRCRRSPGLQAVVLASRVRSGRKPLEGGGLPCRAESTRGHHQKRANGAPMTAALPTSTSFGTRPPLRRRGFFNRPASFCCFSCSMRDMHTPIPALHLLTSSL